MIPNADAKRGLVAMVGPKTADIYNALVTLQNIPELETLPELVRLVGFLHQCVAVSLFPEFYDAWASSMANQIPTGSTDVTSDGQPYYWAHFEQAAEFGAFPSSRPVSWDDDPWTFANQEVYAYQWIVQWGNALRNEAAQITGELGPDFNAPLGANATPTLSTQQVSQGVSDAQQVIVSNTAQAIEQDLGIAAGASAIVPFIGWAVAVILAIVDAIVAIFGPAGAPPGTPGEAWPLQPGELDNWAMYEAAVLESLRAVSLECAHIAHPFDMPLNASARSLAVSHVVLARKIKGGQPAHQATAHKTIANASPSYSSSSEPAAPEAPVSTLRKVAPIVIGGAAVAAALAFLL